MTCWTRAGPDVGPADVTFCLADDGDAFERVVLAQEIVRPRLGPPLEREAPGRWMLRWPRPEVDRMEYRFELVHRSGVTELACDPANPRRAAGPFGEVSVVEWPEYAAPAWWRDRDGRRGVAVETSIRVPSLDAWARTILWSPPGIDDARPLPLLVAHDGPYYARYAGFLRMLGRLTGDGTLPPLRAALVAPIEREEHYSASAAYARALAYDLLPALTRLAPTPPGRSMRVGMGASLGALAMLHAHRAHPAAFGALFLQSGSYFRERTDPQESHFARFRRISGFVGSLVTASDWSHAVPVAMTCGAVEENLANNLAVRAALESQGYDVRWHTARDAHNWTAWRDTFDPHLVEMLVAMWS